MMVWLVLQVGDGFRPDDSHQRNPMPLKWPTSLHRVQDTATRDRGDRLTLRPTGSLRRRPARHRDNTSNSRHRAPLVPGPAALPGRSGLPPLTWPGACDLFQAV